MFGGDGFIHYLECSHGCTGVHRCQKRMKLYMEICALYVYYISIKLFFKMRAILL